MRLAVLFLVLELCALPGNRAAAQTYLGFIAGPTFADLNGSLVQDSDGAYGVLLGADLEVVLSRTWLLDAEIMWIQKGVSNVPFGTELIDFRNAYIEVPLTVNLLFPIARGLWSVGPYLGAAIGYNLTCNFRFEGESEYTGCEDDTPGGTARSLDVSIPIGIAFRRSYPGGFRLSLEVRYYQGLLNALDAGGQSARNRVLAVLFSFSPPLTDANR